MNKFTATHTKILTSAIKLMELKGFRLVTIKDIALATGISEVTIFRHFKNKENLLHAAIQNIRYRSHFESEIDGNFVWDIEQDLIMISTLFQKTLKENRAIIFTEIRELNSELITDISASTLKILLHFKQRLIHYFQTMQMKGKMIQTDSEIQAMTFIWIHAGRFISSEVKGAPLTPISENRFIEYSVQLFSKSLLPETVA